MTEPMPDETILPDDYPIYGDYIYLADGKVYRSDWHDITVRQLKAREGFKEVRRCNWQRFNGTNGGAILCEPVPPIGGRDDERETKT